MMNISDQSPSTFRYPIADLHCDLLCYLSQDLKRTPYDLAVRCAIPQLQEGGVKLQTMAVFTETAPGSSQKGLKQVESYKLLLKNYSDVFVPFRSDQREQLKNSNKISVLIAVENASSFCEEDEPLEEALHRLTTIEHKVGKLAYVSLTWNTENRFGGGAHTSTGLKEDGKRLIEYLCERGIPLDFSHASDPLAFDSLNYIDKNNLKLPVLASHSNFRFVANVPRNLPVDCAKEILKRGGVIGLNFIRPFVGEASPYNFIRQLEYGLKLGFPSGLCFGADFFYQDDVSAAHRKTQEQLFFPEFGHAGTYSKVIDLWTQAAAASEEMMANICYHNLEHFLSKRYL